MIRVVKPTTPPDVLLTAGATAAEQHCAAHDASPETYASGETKFEFSDVYKAGAVKAALLKAQHSKCAYCESFFKHTGYGDIDHFRPKGAYRRHEGDVQRRPGYYWLAYTWANLFYSCQLCNEAFKRELFPLRDNRSRAKPTTRNVSKEKPLLIDPGATDPTDHIGFREEYAYPMNDSREGATTIEVVGLNRDAVADERRKHLDTIKVLLVYRELLRKVVADGDTARAAELARVEEEVRTADAPHRAYSAMVRAYLQSVGER